jgi:hypothetical protein
MEEENSSETPVSMNSNKHIKPVRQKKSRRDEQLKSHTSEKAP